MPAKKDACFLVATLVFQATWNVSQTRPNWCDAVPAAEAQSFLHTSATCTASFSCIYQASSQQYHLATANPNMAKQVGAHENKKHPHTHTHTHKHKHTHTHTSLCCNKPLMCWSYSRRLSPFHRLVEPSAQVANILGRPGVLRIKQTFPPPVASAEFFRPMGLSLNGGTSKRMVPCAFPSKHAPKHLQAGPKSVALWLPSLLQNNSPKTSSTVQARRP